MGAASILGRRLLTLYGSSIFRDISPEYNNSCFRRDNNAVLGAKKGQLAFSDRKHQLINSGNKISFPRIF